MSYINGPISIIERHKKAFIVLNIVFYGLFAFTMALTILMPEIQAYFKEGIDQAYARPGLLKTVGDAYGSKNLVLAIGLTFIINFAVAFLGTALPSLIIPFTGILAVFHRGALWGIMFAPIGEDSAMLVPHSLTLLIEGQAYVLAAFGAYVQGSIFLRLNYYRLSSRWEAYKAGCVQLVSIYALAALVLLVGAVYEVFEAIYIIPHLV